MTFDWLFVSQQDLIGPRGTCCLSVLFFPAFISRYVSPTVALSPLLLLLPQPLLVLYYHLFPLSRPRSLPHPPFSQPVAGSLPLDLNLLCGFIGALNKTAFEQVCAVLILYMCLCMPVPVKALFLITVHSVTQLYTMDRVCCCAARQRGKNSF